MALTLTKEEESTVPLNPLSLTGSQIDDPQVMQIATQLTDTLNDISNRVAHLEKIISLLSVQTIAGVKTVTSQL